MDEFELDTFIQYIENNFPEFLRAKDLIKCGLFRSPHDVSMAKKRGQTPPSITLIPYKIVYPRISLCIWLREKAMNNRVVKTE